MLVQIRSAQILNKKVYFLMSIIREMKQKGPSREKANKKCEYGENKLKISNESSF